MALITTRHLSDTRHNINVLYSIRTYVATLERLLELYKIAELRQALKKAEIEESLKEATIVL